MAKKKSGRGTNVSQQVDIFSKQAGKKFEKTFKELQRGFDAKFASYYRNKFKSKKHILTNWWDIIKMSGKFMPKIRLLDWLILTKIGIAHDQPDRVDTLRKRMRRVFGTGRDSIYPLGVFDHTHVQPSQALVADLYKALDWWIKASEEVIRYNKGLKDTEPVHGGHKALLVIDIKDRDTGGSMTGGSIILSPPKVAEKDFVANLKTLKESRKEIGVILAAFETLNNLDYQVEAYSQGAHGPFGASNIENGYERLGAQVNELLKAKKIDVNAIAEVNLDLVRGVGKVKGRWISQRLNQYLATLETGLAAGASGAGQRAGMIQRNPKTGKIIGVHKKFLDHFVTQIEWDNIEFSKNTHKMIHEQLVGILLDNKNLKKPIKKEIKITKPISMGKTQSSITRTNTSAATNRKRKHQKDLTASMQAKFERREAGSERAGLQTLRNKIQKKLPDEVKKNMGKAGRLTNRTGRFAESVELLELRNSPKGITGEYTYRLSTYETFENTGPRKWKSSYNPKPLIAMSIRGLAQEHTKEKFTYLRRT